MNLCSIRNCIAFFAFFVSLSALAQSPTGTISGVLKDSSNFEVIGGALITVEGSNLGTATDMEGRFEIKEVPAGTYTLSISYLSDEPTIVKNVVVKEGAHTSIDLFLKNKTQTLKEVQVTGQRITHTEAAVVMEMKKANAVVSGISAEQISKTQDRNASDVVRRIPGVTINDRFIMVRGLSERYNTVMLNNAIAPSFEPDYKSFSFDLVPSGAIDRVLIYKSPVPELPGDFAGGLVKIFTTGIPTKNFFNVNLSSSYNPYASFKTFYETQRGKYDWLGYNDSNHDLPKTLPPDTREDADPKSDYIYKYDLAKVGKLFRNDNWLPASSRAPSDLRGNLNFMRKLNIGNITLGNVTSINYSNVRSFTQGPNIVSPTINDVYILLQNMNQETYTHAVNAGFLENITIQISGKHKIDFKNLYSHQGSSQYIYRSGTNHDILESDGGNVKDYTLWSIYRGIYSSQLNGSHELNESTKFNWTIGYSKATRSEPDVKRYETLDSRFRETGAGGLPQDFGTIFSKLNEDIKMSSGNIDHVIHFKSMPAFKPEIKTGWYIEDKKRQYNVRVFGVGTEIASTHSANSANPNPATYYNNINADSLLSLSPDSLLQNKNFNTYNGLILTEGNIDGQAYFATNQLIAYYVGLNLPISSRFNIYSGVRVENNTQHVVNTNHLVSLLPSTNLTFNFTEKSLMRASYGKTLNRPEFREYSNLDFKDFTTNRNILGNPNLTPAKIDNIDIRFEHYPRLSELISFGIFYKKFTNPIERINVQTSSARLPKISFENAESASSYGAEIEVRKTLGSFFNNKKDFLDNFSLILNASLIKSKVTLDVSSAPANAKVRAMMGQSPYTINGTLNYTSDTAGLTINLSYNVIGARLYAAGDMGVNTSDIYEMPRNMLDLTITKRIGEHLEIRAGVQNILNQSVLFLTDINKDGKVRRNDLTAERQPVANSSLKDVVNMSYKTGSYYTLGFNFKF